MAEEHTAASLSKKTVVQLKELLATHSLPVTGKKDDLIQRLLAHLSTLSAPPTVDSTGPASAVDEPDGQGHSGTAEVSQAANAETERSAEEVVDGVRTAPGAEEAEAELDGGLEGAKQGEEEEALKKQAREAEEEKRRKRAERFGGGAAASAGTGPSEEEVAKLKRAEKFGINTAAAEGEKEKEGGKLDKSLALLDAPLGSSRRQGREKPAPTSKSSAPANGGGVVSAAAATQKKGGVSAAEAAAEPAAAVAADPELKRKLEEEEEKKRKRLERFGGPPAEKKAKLDDSSAAATAPAPAETTA